MYAYHGALPFQQFPPTPVADSEPPALAGYIFPSPPAPGIQHHIHTQHDSPVAIRKFKAKSSRETGSRRRFDQSQPQFTSMCKAVNPVQSLVWLRRAVRRWRSRTAASVRPANKEYTADAAVPAGHVAVRVEGRAGGSRRFVVRLAQLSHPAFLDLLRQAEEEYGFASTSGPLVLPCDEDRLRDVLRRVSSSSGSEERRRGDSRPLLLRGMAVDKPVS